MLLSNLLYPNILIMHILCLVIPTKVDTSQVTQQKLKGCHDKHNLIQKTYQYHHY